jgi:hypothetical protein
MAFQRIVVLVALVLLVGTLAMIAWALNKEKKNAVFPPVLANCPDYWQNTSDGECQRGSIYNRGECPNNTVDFSSMSDCGKFEWANGCQVTWDGISNNPDICDTS